MNYPESLRSKASIYDASSRHDFNTALRRTDRIQMILQIAVPLRKPDLVSSPYREKRPKTVRLSDINSGISDDTRLKSMPSTTYAFGLRQS